MVLNLMFLECYLNIYYLIELTCSIYVAEEAAHRAEFIERMDQLLNAFNNQTVTSPALMPHALSENSDHNVLRGILDWLSKIKNKGNDGSILMLLDVVLFVVCIHYYYMYQVDLNLNNCLFGLFQTSCIC